MNTVEFRHVSFQFGTQPVLRDVNFTVEPGETLVLLGRSGSGKTTALRLINAMMLPGSGEVRVGFRSTADLDPVQLRRGIGYVIQDGGLFPHFTVEQNIALVPGLEGRKANVIELLKRVSLPEDLMGRYPRELSGGQRQRVGVARALAADPGILLFDEPFGALDPVTRLELQREFLRLRDELGKTSVFVTHDVREAMKLGTRIALLDRGWLGFIGTPAEFLASKNPEALAFLDVLHAQ